MEKVLWKIYQQWKNTITYIKKYIQLYTIYGELEAKNLDFVATVTIKALEECQTKQLCK